MMMIIPIQLTAPPPPPEGEEEEEEGKVVVARSTSGGSKDARLTAGVGFALPQAKSTWENGGAVACAAGAFRRDRTADDTRENGETTSNTGSGSARIPTGQCTRAVGGAGNAGDEGR